MEYQKKTWVEVDLDRLEHNYRTIRAAIPERTRFLGVVKADAYGHGAVPVSLRLQELGAENFAVSNLDEAIQLRRGGVERPILILGYTSPEFAIELSGRRSTPWNTRRRSPAVCPTDRLWGSI